MSNNWYDAQLKSLVGGKITKAGFISSAEFSGEKVPVLVVELEDRACVLMAFADPEGNGPGWLGITFSQLERNKTDRPFNSEPN